MDRRSFLGTVTAATLLTQRLGWAADDHKIDRIGVQLYTVRSEIAKDFEGSLAKVASIDTLIGPRRRCAHPLIDMA